MGKSHPHAARIVELRAMIAAYRKMTIEEVDETGAGDREIELEAELWRLEQDAHQSSASRRSAA
jgi:hypothetical protein